MSKVQRVSLAIAPNPALRVEEAKIVPVTAIIASDPAVIIGSDRVPPLISDSVKPDSTSCFGPRGAALFGDRGPFWVCDTGHHRLLGWKSRPVDDRTPADWVIGQVDFEHEGRNGKQPVRASSVNVPTGICPCGEGMAVADAWNHRVLIWNQMPEDNNVPADVVLGQFDFDSDRANHGNDSIASASSLFWPYGVSTIGNKLLVADAENRRVLIWNQVPIENGQAADMVLGQVDFCGRDENAGAAPTAMSMRWPHGIALWQDHLCVADAGNNRIMVWKGIPDTPGQPCDFILGQTNANDVDHNQSLYWPRANALNMPYSVASHGDWLITADTASSRLLAWHIDDLETGADARALAGQPNFHDKGDNRWMPAVADSLCWPYGLQVFGQTLVVADSGNNRISLWELTV